ncbi:MAG: YIP1 family protein [Chloroflexi bacterium]|nr:YIP1 family protein [Chloroflexota bacterium]
MTTVARPLSLLWRALWLQPSAYEEIREDDAPVVEGLFLIVLVAVVIAVSNLAGTVVEWASIPHMADIKEVIYRNYEQMSWFQMLQREIGPSFTEQFRRWYDLGWQVFPRLFGAPDPGSAALGIITKPLMLIIGWLVYGVLAHGGARLLGGEGTLSQTLGVTALAVAPQVIHLADAVPFLAVGGVVGTWTLICRYMGLRIAHDLTWPRALVATLFPLVILWLLGILLIAVAALIALPLIMGG